MTRNKKDNNVWGLKDDECCLEFTLQFGVLRSKDFHKTSIETSLFITLYLYFTYDLNFSIF